LWSSSSLTSTTLPPFISNIRGDLTFVVLTMITTLSVISHKEVRFIYPLLPCLHVLAAPHVLSFFNGQPLISTILKSPNESPLRVKSWRLPLLILLAFTNVTIGFYTTQVHQRGVIDVLTFLRHGYEANVSKRKFLPVSERASQSIDKFPQQSNSSDIFAAFLMPCHSTPWRSHLVYQNLRAWALTCEPPLHIPANTPERASYRDEADRFYDNPSLFLRKEMNTTERRWPKYVVGFQGIESDLKDCEKQMPGWRVQERWSGFNSHWHDDSRRKGRVMVWELVGSS
jgi:GPI mannosyltransferase 3